MLGGTKMVGNPPRQKVEWLAWQAKPLGVWLLAGQPTMQRDDCKHHYSEIASHFRNLFISGFAKLTFSFYSVSFEQNFLIASQVES